MLITSTTPDIKDHLASSCNGYCLYAAQLLKTWISKLFLLAIHRHFVDDVMNLVEFRYPYNLIT